MANTSNLPTGSLLHHDNYRIERLLGDGEFSKTYLAYDENLERQVVIKEFFPKQLCERSAESHELRVAEEGNKELFADLKVKFLSEGKQISRLNNPNIVRVYAVFEENSTAYYVMDLIEGKSVYELVKQNGAFQPQVAFDYTKKIGEALEYLHSQGMMHLDVTPHNILIRDGDNQPVLVDFGLAKYCNEKETEEFKVIVSPSHGYAPLEQYQSRGIRSFSRQIDIYSLAATFYFMFTGTAPQEAIQLNEEGLERPADMPEGMYEAISGAMSFNRKDRPESISAFLTELSKNLPTPAPQEEREEVMEVEIEPEPEAVSTQEEEVAVQEDEPEAEQKPEIKVEEPTEEPPAPRRTFVEIVTDEYPEDEMQEEDDPEKVIEAEVAEAEREEEYVEEREEEESETTTPVETYDHVYETEQRRRINHWDWISGLVVIGVTVAVIFAIVYYLGEQEEEEAVVNENIKIDEDGMVTPLDSVAEVNQNDVPEAIVPTESVTPVAEPVAPVPASQNQVVPAAPQAVTPQKTPAPQAKEEATAQPKETKATPQEAPKPKEAPAAQPKPQENKPAEPSAPAATPAPSQEKPSEPTPDAGASN